MTLFIVFALLAFAIILFLWGGSLLMQGWLYQNPADHLPIRAVAAGVLLSGFLAFWCFLDTRNPGKYDTLFEFSPVEVTDHDSFETAMQKAAGEERILVYKKRPGSRGSTIDFSDEKGHSWVKNTSDSKAVAVLIRDKDKPEPTRFKANLDDKGNFPRDLSQLKYTDEAGRWMTADSLGRVHRHKTGVLLANILLNAIHFLLWWMALWVGLRFNIWHALGFGSCLWIFFLLIVQPVRFSLLRPRESANSGSNGVAPHVVIPTQGARSAALGFPRSSRI